MCWGRNPLLLSPCRWFRPQLPPLPGQGTPPVGGLGSGPFRLQLRCSAKRDLPFAESQLVKKTRSLKIAVQMICLSPFVFICVHLRSSVANSTRRLRGKHFFAVADSGDFFLQPDRTGGGVGFDVADAHMQAGDAEFFGDAGAFTGQGDFRLAAFFL